MKKPKPKSISMTHDEWQREGTRRFGPDKATWRFACPACDHVVTLGDYQTAGAPESAIAFSCVGRWLPQARDAFAPGPGPCNYAGGGLFALNPVRVVAPAGEASDEAHNVFAFAPHVVTTAEHTAETFAKAVHLDQKYGTKPYTVHLQAVRDVLESYGYLGDYLPAAWLHDAVEDTITKRETIAVAWGEGVAQLVWAVTGQGANRAARIADAHEKLRAYPRAIPLKLADRIANSEASAAGKTKKEASLLAMYREELPAFEAALLHGLEEHSEQRMWARLRAALGSGR